MSMISPALVHDAASPGTPAQIPSPASSTVSASTSGSTEGQKKKRRRRTLQELEQAETDLGDITYEEWVPKGAADIERSFYRKWFAFMEEKRKFYVLKRPKILNHKPIDLYNFYLAVLREGGYESVEKWAKVYKTMSNFKTTSKLSVSNRLTPLYEQLLLDYERRYGQEDRAAVLTADQTQQPIAWGTHVRRTAAPTAASAASSATAAVPNSVNVSLPVAPVLAAAALPQQISGQLDLSSINIQAAVAAAVAAANHSFFANVMSGSNIAATTGVLPAPAVAPSQQVQAEEESDSEDDEEDDESDSEDEDNESKQADMSAASALPPSKRRKVDDFR